MARTGLSEEVIERLIRAGGLDSLGRPRRELLWQLREVAGSARPGIGGRAARDPVAGRPLGLRLPATAAPDPAAAHRSWSGWVTATRSCRSTRGTR